MGEMAGTDESAMVVGRVTQLVGPPGRGEGVPWLFARCLLHAGRYETLGRDEDIDRALSDFQALPPDAPGRAKLAAILAELMLGSGTLFGSPRLSWALALADAADGDPDPMRHWPMTCAALRAGDLMVAARESRPGFDARAALHALDEYAALADGAPPYADAVESARLAVRHLLVQENPSVSEARRVTDDMRRFADRLGAPAPPSDGDPREGGNPLRDRGEIMRLMQETHTSALRSDVPAMARHAGQLHDFALRLPPGDPLRGQLNQMLETLRPLLAMLGADVPGQGESGGGTPPSEADALRVFQRAAAQPGLSDVDRAFQLVQLALAELNLDTAHSVDDAIGHLAKALELSPAHDPRRTYYLLVTGTAHLGRVERSGDPRSLRTATELLEEARDAAASTAHAMWTTISMPLAQAYRLANRRDLSRSTALRGLRGHAWGVLLESTPDEMQATARHAAEDALETARWCLSDDAAEDAATALDAGRGLILYAAAETRDLEARLTAAGHAGLAGRWRTARAADPGGEVPVDLRREMVAALSGVREDGTPVAGPGEGTSQLLDPPDTEETRSALRALGADALVYLMPGDERDGAAVVVPARAPATWLRLPQLNKSRAAAFDGFLTEAARGMTARDVRDRDSAVRDARIRVPRVLDGICEWAWDAAIGPLLADGGLGLPQDRPARLVLIPVRESARVPWHAARTRGADGTWRYAVEDAVFSYAPSARLLCEAARLGPVPLTDDGLIVADPDTGGAARELSAARLEALAVRDCFYPRARHVGRLPDGGPGPEGRGTGAEVLRWFADPEGGTVAHLACHGIVEESTAPGDSSYLLLHGGEHLAAERVLDVLVRGSGRDIALAVLAACSTGRSGRGHDEAFSLSTTLLAGRVRSVVSATWSVPDAPTSVLMFLFHHFVKEREMMPADALREAQLCMIGRRANPAAMPRRLREQLRSPQASDIASWAGFVHIGR
ncbi:CHAT domain-containing protein [Streptomyces sp. NPDC046988]|uniref:CHAT domain-containing protein n=1 Tax=Streptomyces sp. NPDC046988 TaxID=3154922 RepID=UPI0033FFF213